MRQDKGVELAKCLSLKFAALCFIYKTTFFYSTVPHAMFVGRMATLLKAKKQRHSLLGQEESAWQRSEVYCAATASRERQDPPRMLPDLSDPSLVLSSGYLCRNCGKKFSYSHSMMRHRRKCEGTYHLTCGFCGKRFHRRDLYADHLATNHNAVDAARKRLADPEEQVSILSPANM